LIWDLFWIFQSCEIFIKFTSKMPGVSKFSNAAVILAFYVLNYVEKLVIFNVFRLKFNNLCFEQFHNFKRGKNMETFMNVTLTNRMLTIFRRSIFRTNFKVNLLN
jgi:hypothetical protein